ncbi:hypothetical protein [Streptomyces sp. MI02-7b]|uniref:hypothetical protein n=1 Tax=Streptomyces sp. MI02-7b TaxID=462941 RepID=UPI0029B299E3|nr:hypothetical protein [Streptomyces sp. MI02-7b]MDX3075518.1 hypothetical protein [Streptomyces sp. MI02-7b]
MPLDDALAARMAEPDFWPVYLFDDDAPDVYCDDAEDQESHVTRFGTGGGFALVLELTLALEYVDLDLEAPGLPEPANVGWDDQAHFHPHVMPWRELDLLCRAVALHDAELRHPGPMLALLCRFAFLAENDDLDTVTPLVDAAFEAVRPGAAGGGKVRAETREWFDLRNLRGTGLVWTTRADGYDAVGQDGTDGLPLYSLRTPSSEEFPFAAWSALLTFARGRTAAAAADPVLARPAVREALDRCLAADGHEHLRALADALAAAGYGNRVLLRAVADPVDRAEACWAVETLAGLPQGELVARWFGPSPLSGSRSWRLSLSLPVRGRPERFGPQAAEQLNAALQAANLGSAGLGGSSLHPEDGGYVLAEQHLDILIRDDLARGVEVVSRVLHTHAAAGTATLRPQGKPDVIPLRPPT